MSSAFCVFHCLSIIPSVYKAMRCDIDSMRSFYASRLGQAAVTMISPHIESLSDGADNKRVLGLGYAIPYMPSLHRPDGHQFAAMPAPQGAEIWPHNKNNAAVLVDDLNLPFPDETFDQIIMAHAIEESTNPNQLLRSCWRVLRPEGQLVMIVTCRQGFWARAEHTPFGHGQPYSRRQAARLLEDNLFEPTNYARVLYMPPYRWAVGLAPSWERAGRFAWERFSGILLLQAKKRLYAPTGLVRAEKQMVPQTTPPM